MTTTQCAAATTGAEEYIADRATWLARCAYLLTSDRESALDLAQDTSLRIWNAWARVREADDQDAYVARIMMNLWRSQHRKRRVVEVSTDLAEIDEPVERLRAELPDGVMLALDRLPDRQRATLVLRYWADMSDPAIAKVLGCRPGTVRSLASRAIATLKEQTRHEQD